MAVSTKSALAREPLYLQVCELLTRQIAGGVWQPNATLPNELELARELGVSSGTVRKALEKLEADRLVVRRQGRGTFVLDQTAPEAASRFDRLRQADGTPIEWRAKLIRQDHGAATPFEETVLRIGPRDQVARKRRLLSTATRLVGVEDAALAVTRLPGLEGREIGDWCVAASAQRHGVHIASASEEVRLAEAPADVAALLALKTGTTLLRLDRIMVSSDAAPIEWRSILCLVRDEYYLAEAN
jgi:GntR family transcriptional regulator